MRLPDGRGISYEISRAPGGDARPLILLSNSLCAPYCTWDAVVQQLNIHGIAVLRYDQPGHGLSESPGNADETTFESLADDVAALLRHLQISKLDAWVGVSMGSATGVVFATRYPGVIDKLIVCDTISCSPRVAGTPDVFETRSQAAVEAGNMDDIVEQTIDRWFTQAWRQKNPDELSRVRSIMQTTTVNGFAACCHALSAPTFDLRPLAPKLADCVKEVTLAVGENDANLPQSMKELQILIQGGFSNDGEGKMINLHVLKNAGHVCYLDNLPDFLHVVVNELRMETALQGML